MEPMRRHIADLGQEYQGACCSTGISPLYNGPGKGGHEYVDVEAHYDSLDRGEDWNIERKDIHNVQCTRYNPARVASHTPSSTPS